MVEVFKHEMIGEIHGKRGDGVIQFRGVKYASLANTFAPSKLMSYTGNEVIDGTQLGPMVPEPLDAVNMEFGFIQNSLPIPDLKISATEGLNLNITVPLLEGVPPEKETKLPVFVFVHGGGFSIGSNSWPQYDQSRIVRLSNELGMPVLGVGINYRVGLPGFLTSVEMREAGYESNNGLRDQMNAFRWVKKYIGGFGGDGENVTFIAESAGAVSGTFLLHSEEPFFKRFIAMSGNSLMLKPIDPAMSEFVYACTIEALGLSRLKGEAKIRVLVKTPIEKVLKHTSTALPVLPVIDGDLIPAPPTFPQVWSKEQDPTFPMPGKNWCEELMIGDCQLDSSIFSAMVGARRQQIAHRFITSLTLSLGAYPPYYTFLLLQAYNISAAVPDDIALKQILRFGSDISFFATSLAFSTGWPGKSYVYHMNEPNPWEGEWKGEVSHVFDIALLFMNFEEKLDERQKRVGRAFAGDFVKFVNGKSTLRLFVQGQEKARCYGGESAGEKGWIDVDGVAGEGSGRRKAIFELSALIGLDGLASAWGDFFTAKFG